MAKNYSEMSTEELLNLLPDTEVPDTIPGDVPLTSEQAEQIDNFFKQIVPADNAPESEWDDYLINSAKLGLTDFIALSGATVETGFVEPVQYYAKNPAKLFDGDTWDAGIDSWKSLGSRWLTNYNKWEKGVSLGDPTMPKTGEWYFDWSGTGLRTASDPSTYFLGPIKKGTEVLAEAPKMFGVGIGSELGGEVGGSLAEGTEYEDEARLAGTLVGGVATPTATSVTARTAYRPVKQIYDKYKAYKTDPELVNQQYAGGAAKRFLQLAAEEIDATKGIKDLDNILEEFAQIKHLFGDNIKGIPLFIQMSENPVIKSQVIRLIKTDPKFNGIVNSEIDSIARQIDLKSDIFFGNKYQPLKDVNTFDDKIQTRVKNLSRARQVVDDRIEKLTSKLIPDISDVEIGNRITKLIEKREKLVKEEMSPYYDNLKKEARQAGVFMSAKDTSSIYQFVKNNRVRDIFGKGTSLDAKIMKYLEPTRTPEGFLVNPKLSFEQVDSLKREINRLKRTNLTQDEMRKLQQLQEVIDSGRKNMPGDYNNRLEALDKSYYERVGVPYGSDTIKLMGSKKYIEEVVPVILKNKSSLNQFLDAAGDEGNVIARLAYGSKIYDKAVKNGVVNIPALKALLKKDSAIIDSIPGMKDEINNIIVDNGRLFNLKRDLDTKVRQAEQEVSNNFLKRYANEPDYQDIAKKLSNRDVAFFRKIQKDMKYLDKPSKDAINKNIQRQFVDHIFNNTNGRALEFMKSPKNKKIIDEVFGPGYVEDITKLAKLSDSLNMAQVGEYTSNLQARSLDLVARFFPGLDVPYLSSQFRDRISNNIMKGTRILSKFKQAQLQASTDEKLKEVLLDPDAVKRIANLAETFEFKIDNPLKLQEIVGVLGETLPRYTYGAGKVEVRERQEEQGSVIQGIKF